MEPSPLILHQHWNSFYVPKTQFCSRVTWLCSSRLIRKYKNSTTAQDTITDCAWVTELTPWWKKKMPRIMCIGQWIQSQDLHSELVNNVLHAQKTLCPQLPHRISMPSCAVWTCSSPWHSVQVTFEWCILSGTPFRLQLEPADWENPIN